MPLFHYFPCLSLLPEGLVAIPFSVSKIDVLSVGIYDRSDKCISIIQITMLGKSDDSKAIGYIVMYYEIEGVADKKKKEKVNRNDKVIPDLGIYVASHDQIWKEAMRNFLPYSSCISVESCTNRQQFHFIIHTFVLHIINWHTLMYIKKKKKCSAKALALCDAMLT